MNRRKTLALFALAGTLVIGSSILYSGDQRTEAQKTQESSSIQHSPPPQPQIRFGDTSIPKYLDANPHTHSSIVNYILLLREDEPLPKSTREAIASSFLSQADRNPREMKPYLVESATLAHSRGYTREVITNLSSGQRIGIAGEIAKANTRDFFTNSGRRLRNTYEDSENALENLGIRFNANKLLEDQTGFTIGGWGRSEREEEE